MRHKQFVSRALLFLALSILLAGCGLFPESSFELARESRLPKWFLLPAGLSRTDVTVRMDYYGKAPKRTVRFVLLDGKMKKIAEADGTLEGERPHKSRNSLPGDPLGYPLYEVITVNGLTEVIEHRRMDSFFYITDDPVVHARLGFPR